MLKNTICFRADDPEAFINRADDYFTNKSFFIDADGFTGDETYLFMTLFHKSPIIICNDDRMLPFLTFNNAFDLYLYNYETGEYDDIKVAMPGLRQVNNLESMWRRHVLPECYYKR